MQDPVRAASRSDAVGVDAACSWARSVAVRTWQGSVFLDAHKRRKSSVRKSHLAIYSRTRKRLQQQAENEFRVTWGDSATEGEKELKKNKLLKRNPPGLAAETLQKKDERRAWSSEAAACKTRRKDRGRRETPVRSSLRMGQAARGILAESHPCLHR